MIVMVHKKAIETDYRIICDVRMAEMSAVASWSSAPVLQQTPKVLRPTRFQGYEQAIGHTRTAGESSATAYLAELASCSLFLGLNDSLMPFFVVFK